MSFTAEIRAEYAEIFFMLKLKIEIDYEYIFENMFNIQSQIQIH
jgi:hypothetical protein